MWRRCSSWILVVGAEGTLVFDKLVDVVLGPVLTGGDFKDESNDEQGLLGVPARDHLAAGQEIQVRRHRAEAVGARQTLLLSTAESLPLTDGSSHSHF